MASLGTRFGFGDVGRSKVTGRDETAAPVGGARITDENALLGRKAETTTTSSYGTLAPRAGVLPRRPALGDRTNFGLAARDAVTKPGAGTTAASTAFTGVPASSRFGLPPLKSSSTAISTTATAAVAGAAGRRAREAPRPGAVAVIEPVASPMVSAMTGDRFVHDIDADDGSDPQACQEYAEEIMRCFRRKETLYVIPMDYMKNQAEITAKMRGVLIDWLVDVHLKFRLLQETLYLTVNVLDRFLAKQPVPRNKLQLVGVTAMLIASKYEEIYAPQVKDFLYVCDEAYTRKDIIEMERVILATLDFDLLAPYPLHFLRRFSRAAKADITVHTLSKYLIEITVPEIETLKYLPSTIAAAGLAVALRMCGRSGAWDATLEHYSHYTEAALLPCMRFINNLHAKGDAAQLKAVRKKYSKAKFLEVARMAAVDV